MIGIFGYEQVSSYDNNLGQIIPNNIKLKIAERKYVNLASLINILQYTWQQTFKKLMQEL